MMGVAELQQAVPSVDRKALLAGRGAAVTHSPDRQGLGAAGFMQSSAASSSPSLDTSSQ